MAEFKLLCIASDAILRLQLCSLLISFGYDVAKATHPKHAVALLISENFDLAILDSGFEEKERRELSARIRDKFQTPVLLVGDISYPDGIPADGVVYAQQGANALVNAVERLLKQKVRHFAVAS
jgi:CheY-like chemotaxis protein